MPRTIFTHKVDDVATWRSYDAERSKNMGAFGANITSYVDTNGGNLVGVSMDVTDPEGLKAFMRSETAGAIARKHGVIAPIAILVDGA